MCKALYYYSSQEEGALVSLIVPPPGTNCAPENKEALKHWTASPLLSLHKGTGGDGH